MTTSGKAVGECLGEFLGEAVGTDLAPRASLPWSGFESSGLLFLDAKITDSISTETGVSIWADQSPESNDVVQATTSRQPAVSTDGGNESILFDGADDYLQCSGATGFPPHTSTELTTFMVARFTATSNKALFDLALNPTTTNQGLLKFVSGGSMFYRLAAGGASYLFSDTASTHIFEGTHVSAQRTIFEDGVSQNTEVVSRSPASVIDELVVGALAGPLFYFQGHMHSFLVFNGALSSGDRTTIRNRLAARWGVTV